MHLSGIIPVVAAAFTLMRLSRFNELTAMLAAGVPLLRIAMPIILVSLVLNALLLVDQEIVIPRMIPKLTREHDESPHSQRPTIAPCRRCRTAMTDCSMPPATLPSPAVPRRDSGIDSVIQRSEVMHQHVDAAGSVTDEKVLNRSGTSPPIRRCGTPRTGNGI